MLAQVYYMILVFREFPRDTLVIWSDGCWHLREVQGWLSLGRSVGDAAIEAGSLKSAG